MISQSQHFYLPKCMENDSVNAFMNKSSKKEVCTWASVDGQMQMTLLKGL